MTILLFLALFLQQPSMNAVDINGKPDMYARHQAKAAQDQADRNARIPAMMADRQKFVQTLRTNRVAHEKRREVDEAKKKAGPK